MVDVDLAEPDDLSIRPHRFHRRAKGRDVTGSLDHDVILADGGSSVPILESTRTVSVVFTAVNDPVGAGYVDNLARQGGNATGFMSFAFNLSAKWLELLKQITPRLIRVAVPRDAI